ncbi:hypothetical protein DVDV_2462 [Desulfovibrio sp. DV]|nr:hypothetical protein DVDV_2462 [Desulfovibrio sp. DV]
MGQGKGQDSERAKRRRQGQGTGIGAGRQAHRQQVASQGGEQGRHGRAQGQTEDNAQAALGADSQEIGGHDHPARRTEAFEGGNRGRAADQIAGHRLGHADAPKQKRGQSHQPGDRGQTVHEAGQARLGRGHVAHPPAGGGEGFTQFAGHSRGVGPRRELHPVGVAGQGAGGEQAGVGQGRQGDEQARPQGGQPGRGVGFAHKGRAHCKGSVGDQDDVADSGPKPAEQFRRGHGSGQAVANGQGLGQGHGGRQGDVPIEREGVVGGPKGGERAFPRGVLATGHGLHGHDVGRRSKRGQGGQFIRGGRAQGQGCFDVAAKQRGRVLGHAGQIGRGQAFDAGHGGHAQSHAGHEYAKSPQAGAQFPSGHTGSQEQIAKKRHDHAFPGPVPTGKMAGGPCSLVKMTL